MHLKEVDANLLVILDALLVDASVTRAAERLGRSASAISHALAKLRDIFADELFVRAGQRLVPTAKALELAPTVHVILAGMESLLRPAAPFDPREAERDFAILASEIGELVLVQPLRSRLEEAAPSVRVGWAPGQGSETIEALRQGRAHFAIDIEQIPVPAPDIRVLDLFEDSLVALARPGHPASARELDLEGFAAGDHIAVSALPAFVLIERELAKRRLACNATAQVSSLLAGILWALDSDGLLALPQSLAAVIERRFGLVRLTQPLRNLRIPVRLLWHSSYDRDECHHWVRNEIVALAQERRAT